MPSSRPVFPSPLAVIASGAVFVLGAALAHAETADDARLRQLAGQAASYAGEVRSLLAKGADPNVPDRAGRTALHGAARLGAVETMSALLDAGGNPNKRDEDGNTPLHFASDASQAPLMVHHSIATIRVLLGARANPNLTNAAGRTPLHLAAGSHDEPGGVAALLSSGANPNRKDGGGDTALHAAVGPNLGWPAVVGALLDGGADPRLTNGDGLTALQLFVWDGPDQGRTAAMLVEAGADPDRKYGNGDAPLHAAIRRGGSRGKVEVAEALLATGADPCIRDGRGFIPYSVAAEGGPIHRALDRAGGYELACDRQGEAVALDSRDRRRIQEALARAGFDPGPADGKFGPRTRRAIEAWQQANGHRVTGELTGDQADAILTETMPAATLKPKCAELPGEYVMRNHAECWEEIRKRPGCYWWNSHYHSDRAANDRSGRCRRGVAEGHGTLILSGGSNHSQSEGTGTLSGGKPDGRWSESSADGGSKEGRYRAGKKEGYWTMTFGSGHRREGEWRDDKANGRGSFIWPDGRRYEGGWRDGKPNGHGTFTSADGDRYEGEWSDGCFGERDGRWVTVFASAAACGFE